MSGNALDHCLFRPVPVLWREKKNNKNPVARAARAGMVMELAMVA